jgi:MFS family permease
VALSGQGFNTTFHPESDTESRLVRTSKIIVVLSGLVLVITVPFAMVPALPEMALHFGKSGSGPFIAQMILAFPVLAMLVGAPLGGRLADAIGIRQCLLGALATYVVTGTACLIAPNLTVLIVARLLLGFSAGAAGTLCTALTGEWYQGVERNRILGYAHTVVLAYNILMLFSGGWLVERFGWRAPSVFYFIGAITFVAAYLAAKGQKKRVTLDDRAGVLFSQRGLWPYYLMTFFFSFGNSMLTLQGPFLLKAAGLMAASGQSAALVTAIVTGAIASAAYGPLRLRFNHTTLILITSFSMSIGLAVSGLNSYDARLIVLSYAITGIGYGLYVPVMAALVLERASASVRNRAVGLMNGSLLVASVANPIVISLLRRIFDLPNSFIIVGVALFLIGPLFAFMFLRGHSPAV